jgi:hypothetical protein
MTAEQVRSRRQVLPSIVAAGVVAWAASAAPALAAPTQIDVDLYLHVRVLISIILGLSVTRLVGGLAEFIPHPSRHRFSLIHLGWVAWALFNVVTFWWWEFHLSMVQHWSFGLYLFICLYASMYYFLSVLLFPRDIDGYDGYLDYFLSRRVWFFGFAALTEALDVVDTWIKGDQYLQSLGPEYVARIGAFILLCGVAAATRNRIFHALFVVAGLLYEISFFARYYSNVS